MESKEQLRISCPCARGQWVQVMDSRPTKILAHSFQRLEWCIIYAFTPHLKIIIKSKFNLFLSFAVLDFYVPLKALNACSASMEQREVLVSNILISNFALFLPCAWSTFDGRYFLHFEDPSKQKCLFFVNWEHSSSTKMLYPGSSVSKTLPRLTCYP